MRPRRHKTRQLISLLGLCGIIAAFSHITRAEESPGNPPSSQLSVVGPPSVPVQFAPPSVDQLAERLRATEEANKRLAEKLEKAMKAHEVEMKQLLQKYGELSRRLNVEKTGDVETAPDVGGALTPQDNGSLGDPDTDIPASANRPTDAESSFPIFDN